MKPRTKRIVLIAVIVVLAIVAVPVGIMISAFAGNSAIPDGLQINPNARLIKDGFVDVTMIDLGNGTVALIDAGNDTGAKAILAELQRRGFGAEAVSAILLTHGHSDHMNGAKVFPHAEIYALQAEVPLIEGHARGKGPITHFFPPNAPGLHVSHPLQDGQSIVLGNRTAQVFAVPGHTGGSAVYLIDGVLYFGDSAGATSDGHLKPAVGAFSDDGAQNQAALRALATKLKPIAPTIKTLVFAHTGPLTGLDPLLQYAGQ